MVTMVLKPFSRRNLKKTWPFFSICEYLLSKDIGDSQNDMYKRVQKIPVLGGN